MSTTIKVCPVCSVSWYADKPEKHMMTCTAAAESALDRLKAPVFREGTDLAIVNRHDLAKLIAVAEAAQSYVDRAKMTTMFDIVQSLAALTEDKT